MDEAQRIRTVLLCEDEVLIRMVVVEMLQELGVTVIEAGTAREALAALDARIDMLISDVQLPDGSGIELARQARQAYPGMAVVFATGHTMEPPLENSIVLSKPFNEADLARAVGLEA